MGLWSSWTGGREVLGGLFLFFMALSNSVIIQTAFQAKPAHQTKLLHGEQKEAFGKTSVKEPHGMGEDGMGAWVESQDP